ncbi:MAG: DNA methyltransferase [Gammaproteobacteria bacterium]|nr:DNA methyltransferase [Gammaproteobacteria bacterium]
MALSYRDIKNRAHQFIIDYNDAVKENAESQSFLNDFFTIFDISRRRVASFETPVKPEQQGSTKRIDLFWRGKLLVEMKSTGQNLEKAYQQGIGYFKGLKDKDLPRYVMVCDLNDFRLYDLDDGKDYAFTLAQLPDNLHLFDFMQGNEIADITEYDLNEKAAELLGQLHDALEDSGYVGHQLQIFMVRVLFILFAEDTGVFNRHQFTRYIMRFTDDSGHDTDMHLAKLFQTLDIPQTQRNQHLTDELNAFPYVNGHLFKERIDLPSFTHEMRDQLLQCCLFNWKDISPAIFGSLFQSIMDRQARRNLGAHYTSETNILKVIEPLFLNQLKDEFHKANALKQEKLRNTRLIELMTKIRKLTFFDPACGCGNFLIITYRELRRLELQIMQAQQKNDEQSHFAIDIDPQISLNNFYGIEIDEWPARIAEVAMWLTQHQMNLEFAKSFGREPDLLPLKEHANIHHANALTTDWAEIVSPQQLDYIIGNPPFVGSKMQSPEQKALQVDIFGKLKNAKQLDFVSNWFYKAAKFIQNTNIDVALVSTNSITMGEQVGTLWQPLLDMGITVHFAHRTFQWHNDAKGKAAVHCVIVGFGQHQRAEKWLFDYPNIRHEAIAIKASSINPYLTDAPDIVLHTRNNAINTSFPMWFGNMPLDGGFLFLTGQERFDLLKQYPELEPWIKPVLGAQEFLNGGERYCLWLADSSVKQRRELMQIAEIKRRIEGVRQMRLSSKAASTQIHAETPWQFRDTRTPDTYILVPRVSSERRPYVPMGFFDSDIIATDATQMIPNAGLYEFGILTSQMHMDWMRTVAGRLKSDYRYSAKLVYNNFPWPEVNQQQRQQIEILAQAVLDARQQEVDKDASTTLADLYDPDLMPPSLRKAHKKLDKAVDLLYQSTPFNSPLERVKHLFELYQELSEL